MSQNKNSAAVKKNKLFAGIPDPEIKLKYNQQNFIELKEGEIIYQKGEESNFIYLIVEGEVKIKFLWTQEQKGVVKKYRDEFFGDDELLAKCSRRSSAVAMTDCLLYKISKKELEYIASLNTPMLINLGLSDTATDLYNYSDESKIEFRTTTEKLDIFTDIDNMSKVDKVEIPPVVMPEVSSSIKLDEENTEYLTLKIHPGINKEDFFKQELLEEPEDDTSIKFSDTIEKEQSTLEKTIHDNDDEEFISTNTIALIDEEIQAETDNSNDEPVTVNDIQQDEIIIDDDLYIKIHSGLSLKETLDNILFAAKSLTVADKGIIHISKELHNTLKKTVRAVIGSNEFNLLNDEDMAGKAAYNKEVIIINDTDSNSNYKNEFVSSEDYKIINTMYSPLLDESQNVLCVIQLFNSNKGNFSQADEKKLTALSKHFLSVITKAIEINDLISVNRKITSSEISNFILSDIKIPIDTIKHYLTLLKKQNFSPDVKNIFDILTSQANAVVDLVQTTFEYTQGDNSVNPVVSNSATVLDDILILLSEYVESKNIKLFKKIEGNAKAEIDKRAFYQVLFQITKNACDAMPAGGNIYVTCSNDEDYIRIDIKDEGPGIPNAIRDTLFDPFVSYDKPGSTGVGLSIAKNILAKLNGNVSVQSNPGEGATFIILLPIVKD